MAADDPSYDLFQRWHDPRLAIRAAIDGLQARMWTSLPAKVIAPGYDPATQTATVQATVMGRRLQRGSDGSWSWVDSPLPTMALVPVEFPTGGGYTLTFPIAVGDEGVVELQSRCIDNWWANGAAAGPQPVLTPNGVGSLRQHNLSDGIFRPGARSKPRALSGVSATSAQLRSDDGTSYLDFASSTGLKMFIGGSQVFAVDQDGNVSAKGEITRGAFGGSPKVDLGQHTHAHGPVPDPGS